MNYRYLSVVVLYCVCACTAVYASDWPTYGRDNARSNITPEQLPFPLSELWQYRAAHAPTPAWPPPAENDYWHGHRKLRPVVTFDRALHTVVAEGILFFGSSADDKVYALDAITGQVLWTFFTSGPIRLAPTFADGKLYVASDDGVVYCLDAKSGTLSWEFRSSDRPQYLPGNGRVISRWPIRAGLVVDGGFVYFGAGLFPNEGTYLFALHAESGELAWTKQIEISPQGYMLASADRLYVPTGRTTPTVFSRTDGAYIGRYESSGGTYALLAGEALITGPGRGAKQIVADDLRSREKIAVFNGLRMVIDGQMAYVQSEAELSAFDHKRFMEIAREKNALAQQESRLTKAKQDLAKITPVAKRLEKEIAKVKARVEELNDAEQQCYRWTVKSDCHYCLLMAGNQLLAGGDGKVVVFAANDGKVLKSLSIDGKAFGMSVADGRLYVSTDRGVIQCFGQRENGLSKNATLSSRTVSPVKKQGESNDEYHHLVDRLLERIDVHRGYCLLLGCGDGHLACELARRTSLRIVCIEPDPSKVAVARREIDRAGYYGERVTVHCGALESLPYPDYFANVIVATMTFLQGELSSSASEVFRVLRPSGGIALVGQFQGTGCPEKRLTKQVLTDWIGAEHMTKWTVRDDRGMWAELKRNALSGSGEWTHLYADSGNSACSGDTVRGPLRIQWFGEPGPRHIIDRHHRPMSPLYKDGRLFVSGDNRVITVDAYNGVFLWQREVPDSRRVGVMKDCGQMVVTAQYLLIASGSECWGLDVADGTRKWTLRVPTSSDESRDWGFIDCDGDQIIGSGQKRGASFSAMAFRGDRDNGSRVLEGDFRQVIISDRLFSIDRPARATRWVYKKGAIMNSTITMHADRIFFAESRNPEIVSDPDGRVRIDRFCERALFLVALDVATGSTVWEQPVELPYQHIMYASCAGETLLLTGTSNAKNRVYYDLFAFDIGSGESRWHTRYQALDVRGTAPAKPGGEHGEQWQHPVINGNTIYCRPYAFDLQTGEKKAYVWPRGGGGCGGVTGSANCLFARGGNPRYYPLDVPRTDGIPLTQVTRPGCWINIIPAGGLVLIPESSSGCTCEYPIQTSIAFARDTAAERE